ncbi:LSM domain-containing protein [Halenospora varia]|nr:LSM domain-containing protein [Halenospora varia]
MSNVSFQNLPRYSLCSANANKIVQFMPINPRPMLQNLVNEEVIIRLKWGQTEYKGRLVSIDSYMNIQLSGAEEWIDQQMTSVLGQVLIRCNNVLWIQGANQNNGADTKMDG